MPDVVGGWLCSLLRTLGGNFGRDILYLGIYGLYRSIWDVLAPEGEQEGAKKRLRMRSGSPGSQLGKRCQWACLGSVLLLGSSGSVFHRKKSVYS
jgi:hypothetical protein